MRDLTPAELAEVQQMTDSVARQFKTRKPADTGGDAGLTFSGQVNFSDNRPADKADFFAPEKAETALFDIKRLVVKHSVADSIKQYVLKQNEVRRRNRAAKLEAQKAFEKR